MFECLTRAPTRIDLAGGTLDMWPLANILQEKHNLWKYPVVTVNAAIQLHATCHLKLTTSQTPRWRFRDLTDGRSFESDTIDHIAGQEFPLHRGVCRAFASRLAEKGNFCLEISTNAMAPKGSGLGGSSSVIVAILGAVVLALKHLKHDFVSTAGIAKPDLRSQICELGKNIEAGVLGGLAGNQDHFGAAFGGVQAVEHSCFGSTTNTIQVNGHEFMSRVVLAHSGIQHFSIFNNWLVLEKVLTRNESVLAKLAEIAKLSRSICQPLAAGDWENVGKILSAEWAIRRTLAEGITTPELDLLHATSMDAGALGAKVCGAGGGGVLVALAKSSEHKKQLCEVLKTKGGQILDAHFDELGLVEIMKESGGTEKIV